MTGSDGEEEAFALLADFASFKQRMAEEVAQHQAALHISMNDIIEASRLRGTGGRARRRLGYVPGGQEPTVRHRLHSAMRPATGRVGLRSARTFYGDGSASNTFTPWADRSKQL